MKIAYVVDRLTEISIDKQKERLKFCDKIYTGNILEASNSLKAGDTVFVIKISFLGSSIKEIYDIIHKLNTLKVEVVSIEEALFSLSPIGVLFLDTLKLASTIDHELELERTKGYLVKQKKMQKNGFVNINPLGLDEVVFTAGLRI